MSVNPNDPRVKRTRQLLIDSFYELADERKNIYSISVHDLAARAQLNRATFYAHFQDKFAFLEYWMNDKFQTSIKKNIPDDAVFNADNLEALVQVTFHFLQRFRQYLTPGDKQFEQTLENSIHNQINRLLLNWLKKSTVLDFSEEKLEATAIVVSWGIFGSALQWSRNPQIHSAEHMVKNVMDVISINCAPFWEASAIGKPN